MNLYLSFVIAHWPLFALLVVIVLMMFAYELPHRLKGIQRLSPQQAIGLMNHQQARIIDIRDIPQFHTGHILGAESVKATTESAKQLATHTTTPFIVIAAKEPQALGYATQLRKAGCASAHILRGGMAGWIQAGLPVHKPT